MGQAGESTAAWHPRKTLQAMTNAILGPRKSRVPSLIGMGQRCWHRESSVGFADQCVLNQGCKHGTQWQRGRSDSQPGAARAGSLSILSTLEQGVVHLPPLPVQDDGMSRL